MTKQRIFNKVVNHLLTQGKQSVDGDHCRYYSQNGNKCAVGCLIGKKYYRGGMEGMTVGKLIDSYKLPEYFDTHVKLLCNLQRIHDSWPVEQWRDVLSRYAEKNDLKIPAILKI
jgi:hypothetical protein